MLKICNRFLLFTILFTLNYAVHFASIPIDQGAPEAQLEEGWRWRKSLDTYIQVQRPSCEDGARAGEEASDLFYGPIPVQRFHEIMWKHEIDLTSSLPAQFSSSNIAVAALTLVFQQGDQFFRVTDLLRDRAKVASQAGEKRPRAEVQEPGIPDEAVAPCFFPSTAATKLRGVKDWVKPETIGVSPMVLWEHLSHFIQDLHGLDTPFREKFDLPSCSPEDLKDRRVFNANYQHSEQKLIRHLWDFDASTVYTDSQLYQEVLRILRTKRLSESAIDQIKLIMLHVHSRRDPCSRCSLSLSLFALKAQSGIRSQPGNSDVQFVITTSSRSTYEDDRRFGGHDAYYNAPILVKISLDPEPRLTREEEIPEVRALPRCMKPESDLRAEDDNIDEVFGVSFLPHPSSADDVRPVPDIVKTYRTVFMDKPCRQRYLSDLPG